MRSHLASLKHGLVELINRDYSDFVSLSTKLVDVDAAVVRMQAPLLEIKEKILSFRGSVEGLLMALQSRLKQRARANEAREVLELLLDTFHVVSKDLRQLKGSTAAYRMTNKPLPVRHSPYVSGVLRPLKAFMEGEQAARYLTGELREELLHEAANEITRRYYELAADLINMARKTESSLQKIRLGAQRRAGASSDVSDHNVSDTDKICMQLFVDIQ